MTPRDDVRERYTDAERRDAIARCRDIVKHGKRDELVWTRDLAILLDALSRAQPEGEAVAWVPQERKSGHIWMQYVSRTEQEAREFVERESRVRQHLPKPCDAIPLYTRPAPVVTGTDWRALVAELVDNGDCRYDHHGYCQSHRLDPRPCPHERATAALAATRGEK